ncbi:hypothetical protein [Aeromonas sp. 30P]|uniref:hypothetical protein n=1 Tax=Aeromonas sp. 30P TaxID=3452717 RepID=UPI0038D31BDC
MIGFVSALSSALAVMMIVLTSTLLSLMKSTLASLEEGKSKVEVNIKMNSGGDSSSNESYELHDSMVITPKDVYEMSKGSKLSAITIKCTYGNNLSYKAAKQYSVYNYVLLKKILNDSVHVLIEDQVHDVDKANLCTIKTISKE